ncbi:MAG: chorismate mutase [Burkholderiales bacterium]|nr:chorismate mutase [Burkholderiales bacterium]MDE2289066.1 chorismate mutase [Burkholderiales bacterium]
MSRYSRFVLSGALSLFVLAGTVRAWAGTPGDPALDPLLHAVIERLRIGDEVARAKWQSRKPVEDTAREQALLSEVERLAPSHGVNPAQARQFFENQIAASKLIQSVLLDRWRHDGPPPGATPDLVKDLRPRLDRLTVSLLDGLAQAAPVTALPRPACAARLIRAARQQAHQAHLDKLHRAALEEALHGVCAGR